MRRGRPFYARNETVDIDWYFLIIIIARTTEMQQSTLAANIVPPAVMRIYDPVSREDNSLVSAFK
jgi:hypothetical protein